MNQYSKHWPQFFTATILEWKHLLKPAKYKDIIVESLQYLTTNKRITLYAFVIMDNHVHFIWQAMGDNTPAKVQQSFMKFTAQQIKFDLQTHHEQVLEQFRVNASDRTYQFWERNPLAVDLYSGEVFTQKLIYTHYNPLEAGICTTPGAYHYSSAKFYETGIDDFGMLTHG